MRVSIMHFWISISHKQFQLTALFSYWHVTSKIWIFYIASPCASNLCNEISYCFKIYEIPETSLSLSLNAQNWIFYTIWLICLCFFFVDFHCISTNILSSLNMCFFLLFVCCDDGLIHWLKKSNNNMKTDYSWSSK